MNLGTSDKFEAFFDLGTQPGFEFEVQPEKDSNGEIIPLRKRTQSKSDFKINLNDAKVVSSTVNDEELEMFWQIFKQSLNSFEGQSSARSLLFDIYQFSGFGDRLWHVRTYFRPELRSKLNDWIAACGKRIRFELKATLTNVTAYQKVVPGNEGKIVSTNPIWFEILHSTSSGSGVEFGSTLSGMMREKELRERIEREVPHEKNFRFKADITFYLWMWRPKLREIVMEEKFPQVIREVESVNLKLLKEKLHPDMWIVTDSGISIPCHKCFLAVSSPFIAAMLDERWTTTGSGEVASNNLKLENVSEETVHAFLDYVYISDISKAMESLPIAVELLQLANTYNVALLEEKLLEYLYKNFKKAADWIPANIDSLFKAYLFLEMTGICKLLEILLAKILRKKAGQILQSEEYMELQRDDFESSVKIRKCCETQRSPEIQSVFVESIHLQLNCI